MSPWFFEGRDRSPRAAAAQSAPARPTNARRPAAARGRRAARARLAEALGRGEQALLGFLGLDVDRRGPTAAVDRHDRLGAEGARGLERVLRCHRVRHLGRRHQADLAEAVHRQKGRCRAARRLGRSGATGRAGWCRRNGSGGGRRRGPPMTPVARRSRRRPAPARPGSRGRRSCRPITAPRGRARTGKPLAATLPAIGAKAQTVASSLSACLRAATSK